ncbi:MAG: hypothetical protein KC486_14230 [Myxococcales bacterium]|nr:hypothetical protein [Myxococcales bacterium]
MSTRSRRTAIGILALPCALLACTGGDIGATESAGDPASRRLGVYHQPPYPNYSTDSMWTIELYEDHTATLRTETCIGDEPRTTEVEWAVVEDGEAVQFTAHPGEAFMWFTHTATGEVLMRETDDAEIVFVTENGHSAGPTVGDFRRGDACLVILDASLACGDGSYVKEC